VAQLSREGGWIICSQLMTAVEEWTLEQLIAAGDSMVGMSGLAVYCTERDVLHKFLADSIQRGN
jgi:hypothetical protein